MSKMYSLKKSYSSRQSQSFESYSSSSFTQRYQSNNLQKSNSTVLDKRGFKPSDRFDPRAREYLTNLSKKMWHSDENRKQKIDLQKLFTPSTDFEEIKPGKTRKLYASSAFYTPGLHPTVEDQVALARRISHSLSDISNQRSKGQSMYINRKKRSVKWVHEGDGRNVSYAYEDSSNRVNDQEEKSTTTEYITNEPKKVPLKLVMNPQGHMKDFSSMHKTEQLPILSPEPIIDALKTPKEKGAELFAKRRKKSDKWIYDEENTEKSKSSYMKTQKSSTTTTTTSSSTTMQESYRSTEEAINKISQSINDMKPISSPLTYTSTSLVSQSPTIIPYPKYTGLAYRPSIPQGWNAPPIKLSIDLELPFEDDEPMNIEDNKENKVPEIDSNLKEELLKDEEEILDIYQDLDRHVKLIEEKQTEQGMQTEEMQTQENTTKEIVFKPINIIKKIYETPTKIESFFKEPSVTETDSLEKDNERSQSGEENEEDFKKVSVKELINTFESVKHKEKVHLRVIDRLVKESSTESEKSEVPKYIQLFTGETAATVKDHLNTNVATVEENVSKTIQKGQQEIFKNTGIFEVHQEKKETNEVSIKSSTDIIEDNLIGADVKKEENGYHPEPIPTPVSEPAKTYQLNPHIKRDALSNISPLPYVHNPEPLTPGVTVKMPEPEPPKKPDYSYEAFLCNSPPEKYELPSASKLLDLSCLSNYNTAARGWGAAKDYYRPVHMGKKYDNMIYSDF